MKTICLRFHLLLLLLSYLIISSGRKAEIKAPRPSEEEALVIRSHVNELSNAGRNADILLYLKEVEMKYGDLAIDNNLPSLYNYRGVSQHNSQMTDESADSFWAAVNLNPTDVRSWINLGEARCHQFRMDEAIAAFNEALSLGGADTGVVPRLLRAKGWANSWRDYEKISYLAEQSAIACATSPTCVGEGASGLEYTQTPGWVQRTMHEKAPNAADSPNKVPSSKKATSWVDSGKVKTAMRRKKSGEPGMEVHHRLKVGVISSDFGVHPVSTLIRGMIQFMDKGEIELFCFSLMPSLSWWGENVTQIAEHFVQIKSKNTMDAALEVATYGVDILIDLNGHTLHSGLPLMSHNPAPLQMSFLGLPTSTGAPFIDYYIGDYVALPAEIADHFTEKLILMPPCYIANDYAQMRGGILENTGADRAPRDFLKTDYDVGGVELLFGTLSNFQKIDSKIMTVWTNILRRFPSSKLMTIEYAGYDFAINNLRKDALPALGVKQDRVVVAPQAPWVDHIYAKTALDMILDTSSKNGHTTGLDGIWAGVPTMSMGGGATMPARAAESIATGFDSAIGLTYSLKEYEDIVYKYAGDRERLKTWRQHVEKQRTLSGLFDTKVWTKRFTRLLQSTWEALHVGRRLSKASGTPIKYHVFSTAITPRTEELPVHQVYDTGGSTTEVNGALQKMMYRDYIEKAKRKRNKNKGANDRVNRAKAPSAKSEEQMEETDMGMTGHNGGKGDSSENVNLFTKPVPDEILERDPLLLNIGGLKRTEDWVSVNSQVTSQYGYSNEIDVIRAMHNLYGFPNSSVSAIYSSHCLEHGSFGDGEIEDTLKEWRRVIKPGGLLLVSVPDLPTLAKMYLDDQLSFNQHWMVTKMMYGAQMDAMDYHKVGFDVDTLTYFLSQANFCDINRVGSFNLPFQDTSDMVYGGYTISLNMVARPCPVGNAEESFDEFLEHNAEPYIGPARKHSKVDKH